MVIGDGGVIGSKDDLFVKFDKMNYEPIIENVIISTEIVSVT